VTYPGNDHFNTSNKKISQTKRYHRHHSVTFITALQSNQDIGDKLTTPQDYGDVTLSFAARHQ